MKTKFSSGPHNLLLIFGVVGILFFLEALFYQVCVEFDFKVLAVNIRCEQPLNNRCVYEYVVKNNDTSIRKIELHGTTFDDGDLEVGNYIKKYRFRFGYEVNGVWTYSRPFLYYFFVFMVSVAFIVFWRVLNLKNKRNSG